MQILIILYKFNNYVILNAGFQMKTKMKSFNFIQVDKRWVSFCPTLNQLLRWQLIPQQQDQQKGKTVLPLRIVDFINIDDASPPEKKKAKATAWKSSTGHCVNTTMECGKHSNYFMNC